jgi:hypothetical protein
MDWNLAVAISQVIGAVGVVASLIYVGRQVRLGNALARAEAYRTVSLRVSEMTSEWANDEKFIPIVRSGLFERTARLADLSPDDQTKLILYYSSALRVFEMIHRQVEAGVLDQSAYGMLGGIMFNAPIFSDVWPILGAAYSSDFARVIETRFPLNAVATK